MGLTSGKEFEKAWKDSWDSTPYYFLRLQDAAKWMMGKGTTFMPSNPYDCLSYACPLLFTIELKSTDGTGISFNPGNPMEKPANEKTHVMIKASQVKSLLSCASRDGVIAGFVFNFRPRILKTKTEPNETFFVFADVFVDWAKSSNKSSIGREDCRQIGIPIVGEIKKVHYKYDIEEFVFQAIANLFRRNPEIKERIFAALNNFLKQYKNL